MEIKKLLKQFIISELVVDSTNPDLNEKESLIDNGILDSIGIIKVLTFIEEKFLIKISDNELIPEKFESLCAITKLIEEKICDRLAN